MRLRWPIKDSLIAYVFRLPDHAMELHQVEHDGADFVFLGAADNGSGTDGGVGFDGWIRFTGHGGMLDLAIGAPRIIRTGQRWIVTIVDNYDPAPLEFVEVEHFTREADGSIRGRGVRLTEEGTDLFFGPYTQGTPFADLEIHDATAHVARWLTS